MKKYIILIFTLFLFVPNVSASNGLLKQDSIIECNGKSYGYHGEDKHYHEAVLKNGKWYSNSDIVENVCLSTKDVEKTQIQKTLSTEIVDREEVKLHKCVDGDTAWFILNGKEIKSRFLAINTPESTNKIEPYGKEVSKYVCDKLTKAKKIELEYDENSDKFDKYDRYLAWIIVDGENLQMDLVNKGYAEVKYIYGDYKYLDELKKLEKEAKSKKIGIWSDYNEDYSKYIYIGIGCVLLIIFIVTKNKRKANKIFNKLKKLS